MDHHLLPPKQVQFVRDTVQTALLQRLLQGRARETDDLPELLQTFGLRFSSEQFAVLGLRLCGEGRADFGAAWTPPPEPDLHGLALDFLRSIPGWDAWGLFQDDLFFAVLCRKGQNGDSPRAIARQLVARLSPLHPVSVAVSTEKHGLGGINDAYYEVLEVLGVIDMQDRRNEALSYGDLDAMTYRQMDTTFERDRRLINCVLEGDRSGTRSALTRMEHSGALDGRNTLMLEKRRLLGLLNQMTQEITDGANTDFLAELDTFSRIMDAPAAEQLRAAFQSLALSLCDYYAREQAALGPSRAAQVASYIDKHYADPALSIDQLSGIFKISPSYLSRIFKREKGTGILPYLQEKRIAQARTLLGTTNLRIREIALRVGFSSDQTFTRTFKSVTGLTPTAYRDS